MTNSPTALPNLPRKSKHKPHGDEPLKPSPRECTQPKRKREKNKMWRKEAAHGPCRRRRSARRRPTRSRWSPPWRWPSLTLYKLLLALLPPVACSLSLSPSPPPLAWLVLSCLSLAPPLNSSRTLRARVYIRGGGAAQKHTHHQAPTTPHRRRGGQLTSHDDPPNGVSLFQLNTCGAQHAKKRLNLPTYRESAVHTLGGRSARGPLLGARPAGRGCGRRWATEPQPTRAQPSPVRARPAEGGPAEARRPERYHRPTGRRARTPPPGPGVAGREGRRRWVMGLLGRSTRTRGANCRGRRGVRANVVVATRCLRPGRSGAGTVALSRSCRRGRTAVPVRLMRGLACPWLRAWQLPVRDTAAAVARACGCCRRMPLACAFYGRR
jgi:hypothetical protein